MSLLPKIVAWLSTEAPEYWQWGWLWIMSAANGDESDLIAKTTREWALRSLVEGWPREQIIAILEEAEVRTFKNGDYARTLELRSLGTRLANASEFQMNKYSVFEETAIRCAENTQHLFSLADAIPTLPDERIITVARASPKDAPDIRDECVQELGRRVNLWITLRHTSEDVFLTLVRNFFDTLSVSPKIDAGKVLSFASSFDTSLFEWLLECMLRERRFEVLLHMAQKWRSAKDGYWRTLLQNAIVRTASIEGINLAARISNRGRVSPLLFSWLKLHKATPSSTLLPPPNGDHLTQTFHDALFRSLSEGLRGKKPPPLKRYLPAEENEWLNNVLDTLQSIAIKISEGSAQLSFSTIYYYTTHIEQIPASRPYEDSARQYIAFKHALEEIAIDLHCIKCPTGKALKVYQQELRVARASPHWTEDAWLERQIKQRLTLWDSAIAAAALQEAAEFEATHITPFNERADKWTDLSRIAELYQIVETPSFLRRAANCAIGYGWHKDLWLSEVLDSISAIHKSGAGDGSILLAPLIPIVEQITEFTDGDETDHIRSTLIDTVADVTPGLLPKFYEHYVESDQFRYADETLESHIEIIDLSSPASTALGSTLFDRRNLMRLHALALLSNQLQLSRFFSVSGVNLTWISSSVPSDRAATTSSKCPTLTSSASNLTHL